MMRRFFLVIVFSILPSFSHAEDGFHGLLELSALCQSSCENGDRPVNLYEAPYIQDPSHIIHAGLYADTDPRDNPLWPDSRELREGMFGAVVFNVISDIAFKIKIGPHEYWVKNADAGPYHSYPGLLIDRLAYLQNWDFWLHDAPGGIGTKFIDHPYRADPSRIAEIPVRVVKTRQHNGQWWLQVEVPKKSPCDVHTAPLLGKGWVPAHAPGGKTPAAWFYSRGC